MLMNRRASARRLGHDPLQKHREGCLGRIHRLPALGPNLRVDDPVVLDEDGANPRRDPAQHVDIGIPDKQGLVRTDVEPANNLPQTSRIRLMARQIVTAHHGVEKSFELVGAQELVRRLAIASGPNAQMHVVALQPAEEAIDAGERADEMGIFPVMAVSMLD